jgi:hypothetical protein
MHIRDKYTDLLLIILKERFKNIKFIMIGSGMYADFFQKFFINCPLVVIPEINKSIQDIYLEDILKIISYKSTEETLVDKNMQKETILLEQWNIEKRRNNFKNKSFVASENNNNNHSIVEKESLPKEILVKEANTAIYKAWVEISSRSLNDLLDLINFQKLDGFFF